MHERTERAIARLLFVFCCAIPTLIVVTLILVSWTPWEHERKLQKLATKLSMDTGLNVFIEDFQQVSPTKRVLHNVRLVEPETQQEVAWIRQIHWLQESDRVGVVLHQPKLHSAQLGHAWSLIHDNFLCKPDRTSVLVELSANDLTIESKSGSQTLRDVDVEIKPNVNSVKANVRCLPASSEIGAMPIEICVIRDRGSVAGDTTRLPKTRWDLDTGPTALPCSVLAGYFEVLERFGPNAKFQGKLGWNVDRDGGWSLHLGGSRFSEIELSRLFGGLQDRFTGTADLYWDRCDFVPDAKLMMKGSVQAHDGWMSRKMLRALQQELGFAVSTQSIEPQPGDVHYSLLSLDFNLTDSVMRLTGTCGEYIGYEDMDAGIAMVDRQPSVESPGMLANRALAQTSLDPLEPFQLAFVIAPEYSQLVPVSEQTKGLMKWLLPPQPVVPIGDAIAPSSRVKTAIHYTDESSNPGVVSAAEPVRQP